MARRSVALVVICCLGLAPFWGGFATRAESDETYRFSGTIGYLSEDAVEVGGHRGLIGSRTSIVSDGHPVSPTSIRQGMRAELETDASGKALELRVTGVVE